MARTPKEGLDYFPLDVNFFDDLKIKKLRRAHGPLGLIVYLYLLCHIYANGCYLKFSSLEEIAYDIAEDITSDKMTRDVSKIAKVILDISHIGLLCADQLEKGVMTSDSIQRQYIESLKKAKRVIKKDAVYPTEESPISSAIIALNAERNAISTEEKPISSEEIAINSEDMQQSKIKKNKGIEEYKDRRIKMNKKEYIKNLTKNKYLVYLADVEYLTDDDLIDFDRYEEFFESLKKTYRPSEISSALKYFINHLKDLKNIADKYSYLESSIYSGLEELRNHIESKKRWSEEMEVKV